MKKERFKRKPLPENKKEFLKNILFYLVEDIQRDRKIFDELTGKQQKLVIKVIKTHFNDTDAFEVLFEIFLSSFDGDL